MESGFAPLAERDVMDGGRTLAPYDVTLRARRHMSSQPVPAAAPALAARLGVELTFDDIGYVAVFRIVADDEVDARRTATRRWFYLAHDLELPDWQVTDVGIRAVSTTLRADGDAEGLGRLSQALG